VHEGTLAVTAAWDDGTITLSRVRCASP
jgi:hypothetical protein